MLPKGYKFVIANDEITEEVEEYLYDGISFIAELGGALGLFLGFSFFMIWDLLEIVKQIVFKMIK